METLYVLISMYGKELYAIGMFALVVWCLWIMPRGPGGRGGF